MPPFVKDCKRANPANNANGEPMVLNIRFAWPSFWLVTCRVRQFSAAIDGDKKDGFQPNAELQAHEFIASKAT
jgi:hypothetical protein